MNRGVARSVPVTGEYLNTKIVRNLLQFSKISFHRCPEDPTKCPQGPVSDPCGCCSLGLCAKIAGEACWNSSILELPSKRINEGFCGTNYTCQLRFDLQSDVSNNNNKYSYYIFCVFIARPLKVSLTSLSYIYSVPSGVRL